jgi:hypothetical protein
MEPDVSKAPPKGSIPWARSVSSFFTPLRQSRIFTTKSKWHNRGLGVNAWPYSDLGNSG